MNKNLFPRFIVYRRPLSDDSSSRSSTWAQDSEWQGFVKQMKRHFDKETLMMRTEFDKQKKTINEMSKKLDSFKVMMEEQKRGSEEEMKRIEEQRKENGEWKKGIENMIDENQ